VNDMPKHDDDPRAPYKAGGTPVVLAPARPALENGTPSHAVGLAADLGCVRQIQEELSSAVPMGPTPIFR
jgi:hypothetical protein